jgi:AcrR family transcriptional regulator
MENSSANVVPIRKPSPKSAEKKRELAMHAISSLAELGFARINLRDVAQRSGMSLGVIHYYFESKTELLICCVSLYKEDFILGMKDLIAQAREVEKLQTDIADYLTNTIDLHAHIHRLWYDVRAQAQFDPAFQSAVADVESELIDVFRVLLVKLHELNIDCANNDPLKLYITLDGWFRYFLQRKLMNEVDALVSFRLRILAEFAEILSKVTTSGTPSMSPQYVPS